MILGHLFTQPVTVETYTGAGELGDEYAEPVTVLGLLNDGLTLTRGPSGDMLLASTAFYTELGHLALFRPESRVTVNGRAMQVEAANPRQASAMFRQLEHLEVQLR